MAWSENAEPVLAPASPQAAREVRRNTALRQARSCYDHLAGVAGVELLDALLRRGWLAEDGHRNGRVLYRLTAQGRRSLPSRGVDLDLDRAGGSRRLYAYGCVDWTERRLHLGGALASGILQALGHGGVVRREPGTRVVAMLRPLDGWTDDVPPSGD